MNSDGRWRATQPFAYPFRIFFLSLALWPLVLVPLWLLQIMMVVRLPLALPMLYWHQYEMLFGLLGAAIAGFLLTAVGNWTGTRAIGGAPLVGLWLVWVAGRLSMLLGGGLPGWLWALPDLLFLPLVMLDAGRRIVQARSWRQLPVLGVLLLLWTLQCAFLRTPSVLISGAALVMAMALMTIIGGRITPAFSNNWLKAHGRPPVPAAPRMLDWLTLIALVALLPLLLLQLAVPTAITAVVAAALSMWRLTAWRGWRVAAEPLLWVLHLSLLWIPLALLLMAGSALTWWSPVVWQHAAGIGAMASLILGVMARVALGHTGRPMVLPRGMVIAFVAVQLAALLRVLTALGTIQWRLGVMVSGTLWVLAFALYLWRYAGILGRPRADGKAG